MVLTANHHGVDYFSQSIQGSLIFSLKTVEEINPCTKTVPIFSCGNVPLDNATYLKGFLLYGAILSELNTIPIKLPLFPNRLRRMIVSVAPSFDLSMTQMAETRLKRLLNDGKISYSIEKSLSKIIMEDYGAKSVINLQTYSQQSVILNSRIWKKLFYEKNIAPDIVYLELEKIVNILLKSDLSNPRSLAHCVMFEPILRENVLNELDEKRACWNQQKLYQRLRMNQSVKKQRKKLNGCGTIFFWGVDDGGRKIPLYLETDDPNNEMLRGADDDGKIWVYPFTAEAIILGLNENKLVPSLFTCFLVLSFARGITCVGGYFQAEYLPMMQKGVVTCLEKTKGYDDIAGKISGVSTDGYLSGMIALMTRIGNSSLIPAGPIEIIAGGGITEKDIEKMLTVTVKDAHIAALFETLPDIISKELCSANWQKHLAIDCFQILGKKVVIK